VTTSTEILVLEAMKMENEIFAGMDGVVEKVLVRPQQEVSQGDLLVTIKAS
jgi:acetyl-CoA carboxylase biotin carboxyl carrier protein